MTFFRKNTGKIGEEAAVKHLQKKGLIIKYRNYRCRIGEIDIIAQDSGVLVFVEVRTLRSKYFGLPQESIGYKKMTKVRNVAQYFMQSKNIKNTDCRIDVIAVFINNDDQVKHIEHIKNAF